MLVYFIVDFFIVFLGIVFSNSSIRGRNNQANHNFGNNAYFILVVVLLIFISAFRGDFNSDYSGYENIYYIYSNATLKSILQRSFFSYPEKGYLLLQYIVNRVFQDVIWLFIATSTIIVISNTYQIKKYSSNLMLAFILFVEAGTYYTSFNIMRNLLAISIVMMGSIYIYEKKPIKYFAFVIVAGLIHSSAFCMIPMYFLLNIRLKRKSIFVYPIVFLVLVGALPTIVQIVQRYYWSWYSTSESQYGTGYNWKNIVVPFALDAFSIGVYLIKYKRMNASNTKKNKEVKNDFVSDSIENVWLNATFYHLVLLFMGFRMSFISRFTDFFSLYSILFFCNQVEKCRCKKLIIAVVVILATVYCQIIRNDYPYYFIWKR